MKLRLFRHMWGNTIPWTEFFPQLAREGYAGVEFGILRTEPDTLRALLRDNNLRLFNMVQTSGEEIQDHLDTLCRGVDRWLEFGTESITAQTALDAWPIAKSVEFYGKCVEWERTLAIPIAHETHRGRAFFNPWATRDILKQVPDIKLCCDFSHWVCVAERLLEDSTAEIELAAQHCVHVHARVGYSQGPQVPDPSAPEYAEQLAAHERWWRIVWNAEAAAGKTEFTITPEFGPTPYLPMLPHTNVPVADLARIVEWMSRRLKETFAANAPG